MKKNGKTESALFTDNKKLNFYRNNSDRQVWENSADPDQIAPAPAGASDQSTLLIAV